MEIAIIGGGSVGLLLAARLSLTGSNVKLVTRTEKQAEEINNRGVLLQTLWGERIPVYIQATSIQQNLPDVDLYVLAVKQTQLNTILPSLTSIATTARVLATQNGMGHDDRLKEVLSEEQIYLAVHTEGACRHESTVVEHTGIGSWHIGSVVLNTTTVDKVIGDFLIAAGIAGLTIDHVSNIYEYLWRKLMANVVINPLTTLFEIPNGELLQSRETLDIMRVMFLEAKNVAVASGQKITEKNWQDILQICRNTSRNYSSMLQDLRNGRPIEIDAINGYIVNRGKVLGVKTPQQEAVYKAALLKAGLRIQRG
ncbi:ketopantoate reductase family protein [Brevibacillus daliensis]|uniref:ketopantoate reductase family protein n=1 Tax=Brevibacillus daliensis TaxID=2892995 RepID=UPI001E44E7C2|nr:2-dehydropantoate 2-reductase [Brevibacillus daliensis]